MRVRSQLWANRVNTYRLKGVMTVPLTLSCIPHALAIWAASPSSDHTLSCIPILGWNYVLNDDQTAISGIMIIEVGLKTIVKGVPFESNPILEQFWICPYHWNPRRKRLVDDQLWASRVMNMTCNLELRAEHYTLIPQGQNSKFEKRREFQWNWSLAGHVCLTWLLTWHGESVGAQITMHVWQIRRMQLLFTKT